MKTFIAVSVVFMLLACVVFCQPTPPTVPTNGAPVVPTFFSTQPTPVVWAQITNAIAYMIANDTLHQPASPQLSNAAASTTLTSLLTNNAVALTNLQPAGMVGGFTGIITNRATFSGGGVTNTEYFLNGVNTNTVKIAN